MPAKTKSKVQYGVHPGVAMVQKWVAELPQKTGRSLDQWLAHIEKAGPKDKKARSAWLKEQGLGTNVASWLAWRAEGKPTWDESPEAYLKAADQFVEEMFGGKKAGLRPVYEALLRLAHGLGNDVKACPCKTIVPLYRKHVFAQIKPTTNTRIDLGLALGTTKPTRRLIDTGGYAKKDRITHRIEISSVAEIDDDVRKWLGKAYEADR